MRDGFHGNLFTQRVRNRRPVKEMNNGTEEGTMTGTNISDLTWEDILDDDMKAMVPKFWLKFKPPSLTMQYLMGTLYALIMTAGTCGNIIIIWLFCTTKRLRKPSNYLVVNLAFSDFCMIQKMFIFIYNSFMGGPAAGPIWCTYYGLLGGLTGTSAIMTIAMMSVERYTCVARPLDPSSRMTRSRAMLMVLFIWTYSSVFSFMPIFGLNRYVPEGYLTSCSFDYLSDELRDKIFIMCFFVAAWCVPMVIVCRCYIGIVRCVSESQQLFRHHAQSMQESSVPDRNVENQRRIEIKLAKISFCLISMWTLSWTPYAIVALLGVLSDRSMLTPLSSMMPALFCKMSSVVDPFVYALSNRQFKDELLKRSVCFCKPKKLRDRNVTSILMRTMSGKSHDLSLTDENAEVSLSYEDPNDIGLGVSHQTPSLQSECNTECKESKTRESSPKNVPDEQQNHKNDLEKCSDSEMNNNVGLKRIRVFPIPQVYVIELCDDIIKLKSRRSF